MNNILVLIDLSAGAERIAKLSLKVAQQSAANLLLCNVSGLPAGKAFVFDGYDDLPLPADEKPQLSIEQLAGIIKMHHDFYYPDNELQIKCLDHLDFESANIKQVIIDNGVKMIITGISDVLDLNMSGLLHMIDKASCPVLVIPEHAHFTSLDSAGYLTDLRYCDVEVVRFLRNMNAKVFVTHLSSSGIPDMDDSYAQRLFTDVITSKVAYNKLFLRNVRGNNRKKDLETIVATTDIKLFAMVNRKHYLLERFLSDTEETRRAYHNLPLLIMPYLNRT